MVSHGKYLVRVVWVAKNIGPQQGNTAKTCWCKMWTNAISSGQLNRRATVAQMTNNFGDDHDSTVSQQRVH